MAPTASEIQNELADRVAIITGAGNGIGRGIALELAARGANVVLADISVEAASAVAREVESLGRRPLVTETDVTDPTSTDAMVAAALEEFGSVDIMVNNAGVYGAQGWWDRPEAEMQDWDATFEVNVFGMVCSCHTYFG